MTHRSLGVVRREQTFVGSYRHVVDAQGRIQLPSTMRRAIGPESQETLIITRGLDGCLTAYPLDEWGRLRDQWVQAVSDTSAREARHLIRLITAQAAEARIDAQGRIVVPAGLLRAAGIREEALIVGAFDRIELWDPVRFEQATEAVEDAFDQSVGNLIVFRPAQQAGSDG